MKVKLILVNACKTEVLSASIKIQLVDFSSQDAHGAAWLWRCV